MARKLSDRQLTTLLELYSTVEGKLAILKGALPESSRIMTKAGPPLDAAIRAILDAFDTCWEEGIEDAVGAPWSMRLP
jgi:hypothetical protein